MTYKLYEILIDGKVGWDQINEWQLKKVLHSIKHNDHWKNNNITYRLMKECPKCHSRISGGNK